MNRRRMQRLGQVWGLSSRARGTWHYNTIVCLYYVVLRIYYWYWESVAQWKRPRFSMASAEYGVLSSQL